MNTKLAALVAAFAVAFLGAPELAQVAGGEPGSAWAQQDTTQADQVVPRRGARRMGPRAGMRGARMGRGLQAGPGHTGPRMMLGLKSELGLSDAQVGRLEKIHEDHRALMESSRSQLQAVHESLAKARQERDYDAMEKGIDELGKLRMAMAKSGLNVERQSLGVLNDAQRQKLETWQEGARLLRQQRAQRWQEWRGERQGQRQRERLRRERRAPPPNPQS